jgi:flagellar hook-length control protein FliK
MPKTQPQAVKPVTTQAAKNTATANVSDPAQTLSDTVDDANRQAVPTSASIAKTQPQQGITSDGTPAKDGSQPAAQHDAATQTDTQPAANTQTTADNAPANTTPQAVVAQTNAAQPAHLQTDAPANAAVNAVTATAPAQSAQSVAQAVPLQTAAQPDAAAQPNVAALALTIAVKTKAGQKQFDIRLDPPELGRVDVKLSIDDAGKAQATLQAEKPHTLELLQRDRGTLERALRDAGLDLAGGGLNFSLKGQDKDANSGASTSRGRNLSVSAIADTGSAASLASTQISPADSRLDIRV